MDYLSKCQLQYIFDSPHSKILKRHDKTSAPKVVEVEEDIIKIFYPKKKLITSDRFHPRARRFYSNSNRLLKQGFAAPKIKQFAYCPELKIYLLRYEKLQGTEVRELAKKQLNVLNFYALISFIAKLHQQGIFFRAIHLGNILIHENKFSLIDVTDVRFINKPLTYFLRLRNLKHLLTNREDKQVWKKFSLEKFLPIYFENAVISRFAKKALSYYLYQTLHAS